MTYLKQFVGWVTALKDKIRQDPFFRTEWNIIILQVIFALSVLSLVALAFQYLYRDIAETLLAGIMTNISNGNGESGANILASIEEVKSQHFIVVFLSTTIITAIFGYFIARVTLTPTREALIAQKRFISNIAHEMRTPLSIVKTNTEILLLEDNLDQKVKKTLESNVEEFSRMSEIINNLLSLNTLVKPERVNFNHINLCAVVDAATKKMEEFAASKEIKVTVEKKNPQYMVWGNFTALEQIVINLLKNAISYTPSSGKIAITIGSDFEEESVITVEDTGVGISPKDLPHIFEPFFRAERSRNRRSGSSGLGLAIVNELVRLHKGRIHVKSVVNQGTKVKISFPRTQKEIAAS